MNAKEIYNIIDNKIKHIEKQKQLSNKLNEELKNITKTFHNINKNEMIDIINTLYWKFPEISVKNIAGDIMNTRIIILLKYIQPINSDIKCKKCNKFIQIKTRNDCDFEFFKKNKICLTCWDIKTEQCKNEQKLNAINQLKTFNKLKWMSYTEYLKSNHWINLRNRFLKYSNNKCGICQSQQKLQVHHRTYKNKGCEEYKDLIVLCKKCHELYHKSTKE